MFSEPAKNKINSLIKIAYELYKIRDKAIAEFEKKELTEPNFEWIEDIDAFNRVLDRVDENVGIEAITDTKVVNLRDVRRFSNDILSGKINQHNAEKEYIEKIMGDENLLKKSYKSFPKSKNAQEIASIMNDL